MRQVVLDTETTGLDYRLGDRVVEIGCIELLNRKLTGQSFHRYINPEWNIAAGALEVHGLSNEFLQDKPKFGEIVDEFLDFVRGAELIIHNAPFDVGFLNSELVLQHCPSLESTCDGIIDTLKLARELHPGRKNSLDALCSRYAINNSGRSLHGALLDAELLAEVFLAMTRGQESLIMDLDSPPLAANDIPTVLALERPVLRIQRASGEEQEQHEKNLSEILRESRGQCVWFADKE